MRWRLLLTPPMDGPRNMAVDHALMHRARGTGESVLRVYSWSRPVLSLGRNQKALGVYDEDAVQHAGIEIVRRPTGGRALLHHREITYSVTAPAPSTEGLGAAYRQINNLLLHALGRLGVHATLSQATGRALRPTDRPCFAEPAAGEIVVGGRKLVGSAQWREDGAMLQHGSIIVDDDQPLITRLTREPSTPPEPAATLRAAIGRESSPQEIAAVLCASLCDTIGAEVTELTALELSAIDDDEIIAHYRDSAWTWRR